LTGSQGPGGVRREVRDGLHLFISDPDVSAILEWKAICRVRSWPEFLPSLFLFFRDSGMRTLSLFGLARTRCEGEVSS